MEYYKSASDVASYSNGFRENRKEILKKYVVLVPIVVVVLCVVIFKFFKYAGKVNSNAVYKGNRTFWEELMFGFHVIFHPIDGFWDLKHEKRGSVRGACTILGVTILAFYYQSVGRGYLVNPQGNYSGLFIQLASVALPVLLFSVSNWCLTTLFDGEGSFRDITVAVGYAISPMPFILIISTLLSNIVTLEEAMIVSLITTVGYVWCALLLFFGLMVTHDYSMGKNLLIVVCTILGMAIIIFMALLFSGLIGKMVSFVSSIITEIAYRM